MKTLILAIALLFVMTGCGTSEHCLDGTTWKWENKTLEIEDGVINVGGAMFNYQCVNSKKIIVNVPMRQMPGTIKGNTLNLDGVIWVKQ